MTQEVTAPDEQLDPGDPVPEFPPHKWGIGAFLLVEAALLLSAVFIGAIFAPHGDAVSVTAIVIGTIAPTAIAAGVTLLITKVRGNGPKLDLRWGFRRKDLRIGLTFGGLGLVVTTIAAGIWTKVVGQDNATSAVGDLINKQHLPLLVAVILFCYIWLIGPICEEIIFRGLLWGALERHNWGRWTVFVLTTAVFAVSHLEPLRTSLLLVIGVPIGLARLYSGRLGASIVAHQVNNFLPALAVLLLALGVLPA